MVKATFFDGGEMGALMRAKDWSTTPLGSPETWPQSLTTAVRIILQSRYPMFVWWGRELTNLYNDSYVPFLGKKHPAALGRPAYEVWSDIWEQIGPRTEAVMQRGESTFDERLLLMMDRYDYLEETYFTFSYSPLPNDEGTIGGLFCAVMEETERVISERRMGLLRRLASKTSETRTPESVCRLAADLLAESNRDLPFALIYLHDAATNTLNRAANAGIAAAHPSAPETIRFDLPDCPWRMDEVMATGTALVLDDLTTRTTNLPTGPWQIAPQTAFVMPLAQQGQERPLGVLVAGANPHRQINDDFTGFVSLLAGQLAAAIANANAYEVERKRAEALSELDRAKTAFFSNVSHEFRTPITLLLGPLEEALTDDGRSSKDTERLETAHRNGLRLLKLVNSLLDFSRIEAGRELASYEPVDIAMFTADLASGFRSLIERAGLVLSVECPAIDAPVFIDREMWEKIVLNLLSNAFKFTLQGQIRVTQQLRDNNLVLAVSDTGAGIPERELSNVFKRFHRIEGTQGRSFEGTGIGLALVQELVKIHDGSVAVQSTEGLGTTFTVTIPVGRAHLPPERVGAQVSETVAPKRLELFVEEAGRWTTAEPSGAQLGLETADVPALRRPKLLVADDNADMRDYIGRLLGDTYQLRFASNGEDAAAMALQDVPDMVLTDVMMPVLDGVGLVSRLRDDDRTRTVPIIMLSARAGEEARVAGLQGGADDYLTKPFTAAELSARVATHIKMAQLRKESEMQERHLRAEAEKAQRELQNERKRLAEVFQHAPAFIAVLRGPDFVFEMTNPQYQQVIGNRNILNQPLREALPEVGEQGILALLQRVYETGEPYLAHGYPIDLALTPDGPLEKRFFDFVYQPVRGPEGQVSRIIALGTDVTERHRTQDALLRSEKLAAMGRLAASIAHEINNPLASVTNLLYLIERSTTFEEVKRFAKMADQELRRVTQIATQTLRFHKQSSAASETRMSTILQSILTLYHGRFLNAGISVEHDLRDQTPLLCLEGEVRQALTNLVANAVDAMPHGGRLLVRTREIGEMGDPHNGVVITIADTGEGISAESKEHLFEAFFTTKGITGTGLGLWITKNIIDKHAGRIRVKSSQRSNGQGTVFRIFLPRTATMATAQNA